MKYVYDTIEFNSDRPSAVTLGKFDGLHRGHQKLIREILRLQKEFYGIVFTIAPEQNQVLLTAEEKRRMLEDAGIDCMIRCPFVPEILRMEPERFVEEVLVGALKAKCIVVGTDFRFGCRRSGDVKLLERLQDKFGYTLIVIEKACYGDREISSTYVKEALADSNMELVRELLGFPYPVLGTIQHGKKLGRRIGMPTINLVPAANKLLPREGVYYSEVRIDRNSYNGVTNIGYKPTVDGSFRGVETYLYDVEENLYEQNALVQMLQFRRPERKFAGVEELKQQMEQDILAGKAFFSEKQRNDENGQDGKSLSGKELFSVK